nr:putative ribonuclease H-like domain-containing protein [Tanacetum cinerariifolium]
MTGNISYLSEYKPFNEGYMSFGHERGKITGKGSIKTGKLEFENVYFVEELKYNLFSVSQICDNKNSVMCTDTECLVLGKDFKLVDDRHEFLRTPRQHNMYTIDLKNVIRHTNLTCLIAKASLDESMLWHRRLGHLNFKTMNKLVRSNMVKVLPSKSFENDHSYVACLKGKQHKASCTKKDAHQAVKEKESPLGFIALPNWFHEGGFRSVYTDGFRSVPLDSRLDRFQQEILDRFTLMELDRGGSSYPEPLSLGNDMSFENNLEDFFRDTSDAVSLNDVEAYLSNKETAIQFSPTPTGNGYDKKGTKSKQNRTKSSTKQKA